MKRHYILLGLAFLLCGKGWAAVKSKALEPAPVEAKKIWKLTLPDLTALANSGDSLPKDIDVLSFNHGIGLDLESAVVKFQDMSIVKCTDAFTPLLLKALVEKRPFKEATLELRGPTTTVRYDLADVQITSIRPGGSAQGSDEVPLEEVSFSFKSMKLSYSDKQFKCTTVLTVPK